MLRFFTAASGDEDCYSCLLRAHRLQIDAVWMKSLLHLYQFWHELLGLSPLPIFFLAIAVKPPEMAALQPILCPPIQQSSLVAYMPDLFYNVCECSFFFFFFFFLDFSFPKGGLYGRTVNTF